MEMGSVDADSCDNQVHLHLYQKAVPRVTLINSLRS